LPSLLMPLFWIFLVLVLSAAVLVIVIVDCIRLGLRFCDTIELHRHPSQHRDDPLELSFHGQAQCCIQPTRCNKKIRRAAHSNADPRAMSMKPRQRFGDRERIGRVFDRQSVNIESIMVKEDLGHRNCSSITSTSTATLQSGISATLQQAAEHEHGELPELERALQRARFFALR
jgi:hypothetical protein